MDINFYKISTRKLKINNTATLLESYRVLRLCRVSSLFDTNITVHIKLYGLHTKRHQSFVLYGMLKYDTLLSMYQNTNKAPLYHKEVPVYFMQHASNSCDYRAVASVRFTSMSHYKTASI